MQYGSSKVGGAAHVPVGWDWWAGLLGNSKYYDYSLSINGTERVYGNDSDDYLTDVIVSTAILEFLSVRFREDLSLDRRRARVKPINERERERREDYSCLRVLQSNLAVDFINAYTDEQPFLMVLAPPAPHAPFTPADRHNHKYNGTKAKRTPNFNVPVHQV